MPVKRRIAKRQTLSEAEELKAWTEAFECKDDTFDDLESLGLFDVEAIAAAAPDAWRRLGALYMQQRDPAFAINHRDRSVVRMPWAFEEFGGPKGWKHAD